ncbi:MAG: glycosyltransferase family 2 protein [Acutalibacteraceae bacterium]|uniref:glycosyltransferase family 2 protein n=1 Tax=Hominenteromicrobium sp. TaxID=3073581 RepID=UPI001E183884|nr:glycosyltransferase family 2 protein [Clostridiales bacterium]MEE0155685.1 glycosyltransferase family 2 protein [Acutalibacteraceae bacterium]
MKITASVVTYNSRNEITGVLESLMSSVSVDLTVYVVDNASTDDTVSYIRQNYPNVVVLPSEKNLGYGGGHNIAINMVDSDYHVVINPDIKFQNDVLRKMYDYMEEHKDVVLLSPKILNSDGSEQFLPKRHPSFKYVLAGKLEEHGEIFRKWRSEYTRANEVISEPVEVDVCTGCFMFFRMDALKKCKGFDELFFMYFEDFDLTRRVKQFGKAMFVPQISVEHEWKRENKSGKTSKIMISSFLKYMRKWKSM